MRGNVASRARFRDAPGTLVTAKLLLAGAVLLAAVVAAGCSKSPSETELTAARQFAAFPLYWVGPRFEKWRLAAIEGLGSRAELVTFIYGTCRPHDGGQPSCAPPLQIQVFPLCWHLDVVAADPIWRRRRIRGAPVGMIDGAPVLFSQGAQVKVYRGKGSDAGLPRRALRALRSINRVPPVVDATDSIPPPDAGLLEGTHPCTS
jgi:hypothetical protein